MIITVKFLRVGASNHGYGSKSYQYNCEYKVSEGDYVVVDSPNDGYVVVKVNEVNVQDVKATKSVVCIVDDTKYKLEKELEKKRVQTLNKLKTAAEKASKLAVYKALAQDNPEIKDLLNELEILERGVK